MLPPRRAPQGFTLIELLVSMSVLTLLIITVVGLLNAVSSSTAASRRRMNADNEARRVLDRMGSDFARMFKRADADCVFAAVDAAGAGANDKFFFYSEAPTYYDTGTAGTPPPMDTAGLVGYRINSGATVDNPYRWQLERLGKSLSWDGAASAPQPGATPGGVVFLTYPASAASPTPTPYPSSTLAGNWGTTLGTSPDYDNGADAGYQVLSAAVFRLEYCFVLKTATAASAYSRTRDPSKGFRDVAAIVVAIAILDPEARGPLPRAAGSTTPDMSKLITALTDPDLTNYPSRSMAEIWNGKIKDGTFVTSTGIPASVAAQVRVYQRSFPLNTPD